MPPAALFRICLLIRSLSIHLEHDGELASVRQRGRGPAPEACIKDCGYKPEAPTPPITTTSTTATTSSSSSVSKDVKCTLEKKSRVLILIRRASEEPHRKNLTQEMEAAAEQMEEEEELLREQPAPPAAATAPGVAGDESWSRTNSMFGHKLHSFAQEFGTALYGVEVRIGTEIQKEREEHSTEVKNTNLPRTPRRPGHLDAVGREDIGMATYT